MLAAMRRASGEGMRVILLRIELVKRFLKEAQHFIVGAICKYQKFERPFYQLCFQIGLVV
jgi:hypothetical protein